MPDTYCGHALVSEQISAAQLKVIDLELTGVLQRNTRGEVAEFGCYSGTTSLFLRRILDAAGQSGRQLHVYDSFAGLPAKQAPDNSPAGEQFQAGQLSASRRQLQQHFKRAGLREPTIHKAWFNQLTAADMPAQLCFAFLDGDFYESILDSLRLCWPRLQAGGTIVIDDFSREALPGVQRAVSDYFTHRSPALRVEHNMAVIRR